MSLFTVHNPTMFFQKIAGMLLFSSTLLLANTAHAAVTSSFIFSGLTINTTDSDIVTVTEDSGFVKVNGEDPDSGAVEASLIQSISFFGDDGNNIVDFSGVTKAAFSSLTVIRITTAGGIDTITGSEFGDDIIPGTGIDNVVSYGGTGVLDTYFWTPGDGNETIQRDTDDGDLRFSFSGTIASESISINSSMSDREILTSTETGETVTIIGADDASITMSLGNDILTLNLDGNRFNPLTIRTTNGNKIIDALNAQVNSTIFLNNISGNNQVRVNSSTDNQLVISAPSFNDPFYLRAFEEGLSSIRVQHGDGVSTGSTQLAGFNRIDITGSNESDYVVLENIDVQPLETFVSNLRRGDDEVTTRFSTQVSQTILGSSSSFDTLTIDAVGLAIENTNSPIFPGGSYKPITYSFFDSFTLINEGVAVDDIWKVE